jgi:hypothetical protein
MSIKHIAATYGLNVIGSHNAPEGLTSVKNIAEDLGGVKWKFHESDRGTSRESRRWEGSADVDGTKLSAILRVVENRKKKNAVELQLLVRRPSDKIYEPVETTTKFTDAGLKALLAKAGPYVKEELLK